MKNSFPTEKRNRDGLSGTCIDCTAKLKATYYQTNKDEISTTHKLYRKKHKKEAAQYSKKYRKENRDKILMIKKLYYENNKIIINDRVKTAKKNNKEHYTKLAREYYEKNKENLNMKRNVYRRQLLRSDPLVKLQYNFSLNIRRALKNHLSKKEDSIKNILPYTIGELKQHLESLFEPWMNWNNHGNYNRSIWKDDDQTTWTWQIDHVIPQSNFKYQSTTDREFQKCWALNNLRPYSAKQNVIDGNKR